MGTEYGSGDEPCAYILAPEGATVEEANCGEMALFLPGDKCGMSARDAYEMAAGGHEGLSLVGA
jgi:hypothetical protein